MEGPISLDNKGNDDNVTDLTLITLHYALKHGDKSNILNTLRNCKNQDFWSVDKRGNTVLHMVLKNDKITPKEIYDLFVFFLQRNVNPNATNYYCRMTVLFYAIVKRWKKIIKILLRYGATKDIMNSDGDMPTHYFVKVQYNQFNRLLKLEQTNRITRLARVNYHREIAEYVEWLSKMGFNFDAQGQSGFSAIQLAFDLDLLHILPALMVNTNDNKYLLGNLKPLINALLKKQKIYAPIFDGYVANIANVLFDRSVLIELKHTIDLPSTDELIDDFAKYHDEKSCITNFFHALMRSCALWTRRSETNCIRVISKLVQKGLNVNERDRYGVSALYHAIEAKNLRILQFLDDNGIDFSIRQQDGGSLLSLLFSKNSKSDHTPNQLESIIRFLISKGCNIHETDTSGKTYVHLASVTSYGGSYVATPTNASDLFPTSYSDDYDDFKFESMNIESNEPTAFANRNNLLTAFLRCGIRPNIKDNQGETALSLALLSGQIGNAEELIAWAANVHDTCVMRLLWQWPNNVTRRGESQQFLLKHFIKLSVIRLTNEEIIDLFNNGAKDNKSFYMYCLREISVMDNCFIAERVSIFDFLKMSLHDRCKYAKKRRFHDIVNATDFKQKFSINWSLILGSYYETLVRINLLEPAIIAWQTITKTYMPEICIEHIFNFFSNDQLQVGIVNVNWKSYEID